MSESLIEKENTTVFFSDYIYYRPLIPLLIAFISGLAAANHLPEQLLRPALSGIFISAGMIIYAVSRHKNSTLLPLILFFCLGYYALTPWQLSSFSKDHVKFYVNDSMKWKISGIIDETPLFQSYRTVCILDKIRLSGSNKEGPGFFVRGKIRAIIYDNPDRLAIGDRLTFDSKIRPFTNFKNPGGFDYIKYMAFKRIWGNAYTSYQKMAFHPAAKTLQKHLASARQKISAIIDQSSDNDANTILKALILGSRQQIPKPLREAFNRAGISHILAISGLHIGIVASFAFFMLTSLFSRFNTFLLHAWTRKWAAIFSLIPIIAYAIIAGMSPSTQRAVIMVGVFLLTFLLERDHDIINTVCVAALTILIISPPSLISISFQLSFAAVLSIIYGASIIFQSPKSPVSIPVYWLKTIVTFCVVSGLAIIGTAPLTMFYFNQISLMGIFSNLIFVPLIGFVVVPLGLFSVLILMPVCSSAAVWGLNICNSLMHFSIEWIYRIADLPYAAIKTITPSFLEIICMYVLLGFVLYLLFPNKKQKSHNKTQNKIQTHQNFHKKSCLNRPLLAARTFNNRLPSQPPKLPQKSLLRSKWALRITGITLLILSADIYYWIEKRWGKEDLTVSIVDVGQGNAALIELPGGQCALIDGGGYSNNALFDIGEKVIAPFLWHKKIKTVETVFLTHYDSDHVNGLIFILKHFNVRQVFANHDPATCFKNKKFNHIISDKQIHYPPYTRFPKELNINGVIFKILYPQEQFAELAPMDSWRDSNNNSMVIQVNFENQSILFPGDIMKKAEKELVALNENLQSDILVSPHHGSCSSSNRGFLKQVHPKYIIISCGRQNRFGFPAPDVLARYKKNNILTLRTDIDGGVCISYENNHLELAPMIGEKIWIDY